MRSNRSDVSVRLTRVVLGRVERVGVTGNAIGDVRLARMYQTVLKRRMVRLYVQRVNTVKPPVIYFDNLSKNRYYPDSFVPVPCTTVLL